MGAAVDGDLLQTAVFVIVKPNSSCILNGALGEIWMDWFLVCFDILWCMCGVVIGIGPGPR